MSEIRYYPKFQKCGSDGKLHNAWINNLQVNLRLKYPGFQKDFGGDYNEEGTLYCLISNPLLRVMIDVETIFSTGDMYVNYIALETVDSDQFPDDNDLYLLDTAENLFNYIAPKFFKWVKRAMRGA